MVRNNEIYLGKNKAKKKTKKKKNEKTKKKKKNENKKRKNEKKNENSSNYTSTPNIWANDNSKINTRFRESNSGPNDCESDALPDDQEVREKVRLLVNVTL